MRGNGASLARSTAIRRTLDDQLSRHKSETGGLPRGTLLIKTPPRRSRKCKRHLLYLPMHYVSCATIAGLWFASAPMRGQWHGMFAVSSRMLEEPLGLVSGPLFYSLRAHGQDTPIIESRGWAEHPLRARSYKPVIAQLVEHLTVDLCSHQMVPGSIPGDRIYVRLMQQMRRAWTLLQKKATGLSLPERRAHPDLNQGPADLQSAALATELCTHGCSRHDASTKDLMWMTPIDRANSDAPDVPSYLPGGTTCSHLVVPSRE